MNARPDQPGIRTRAVHAGEGPDPVTHASAPNLVMSTTFVIDNPEAKFSASALTEETPYVYTRWSNPTVRQLERKLADLEGAEDCVAFASGMAAACTLFLNVLQAGDHLVVSDIAYAGVVELAGGLLKRHGVEVTPVDLSNLDELVRALRPKTRLVHAETPANPILRLTDIREAARITHQAGALFSVDSTFATPVATRPIGLGADYVIHSLTKYICGHGDAVGGAVLGTAERMAALRQDAIRAGGILSPFNAWLILRGAATLPVRMAAHAESAMRVARFLESHPRVTRVIYPGLPSHPQHELAGRQMANFSGMLSFIPKQADGAPARFIERLRVFHYAVSLGHHRSLIFYLPTSEVQEASFHLGEEHLARYRAWAGDGIFRVSIGLEDPDDLCADLDRAL